MPEQPGTSSSLEHEESRSKQDGLYLLVLGAAVFLLFGLFLQNSASDSREDFRAVVYGSRCLLHSCDPYNQDELFKFYEREFGTPTALHFRSHTLTQYVNLPATILVTVPFALLSFKISSLVWSAITAASLILGSFLIWNLSSSWAPVLSAALIAISLANGAIVLGNGNPAGIVVAFCLIAVWCFLKDRFILAGVVCLAVSLALKPHDSGLVWLYLLLAGGKLRTRALQTLVVTVLLSLSAVIWVSKTAPNWLPELRTNMAMMAARGGNNDPGPEGPTSRNRAIETIVSLQSAIALIQDRPNFYNTATAIICGFVLVLWIVGVFLSPRSGESIWLALAPIVTLTMLAMYHRAYDTRLLILAVPACAILASEKGKTGKCAIVVTTLGLLFTGELPNALIRPLISHVRVTLEGPNSLAAILLSRPAPFVLVIMTVFFVWVFLSRSCRFRRAAW